MKRSRGGINKLASARKADASPTPGVLRLYATRLLAETLACTTRILVHQGGARASKSYAIMQALILVAIDKAIRGEYFVITIARKSMPSLKSTAMKDWLEIMQQIGIYDERLHNKTDNTYALGNVTFGFVSMDDPQKIRGRKQDIVFMNEANEFTADAFMQFELRTSFRMILDYNPSEEYHWIYSDVLTRPDCTFVQSTYKDNPFLPIEQVQSIERLKDVDPVAWSVYGLGERGASVATIFPDFQVVEGVPQEECEVCYGLDFGYTMPSALVEVRILGDGMYLRQLLYKRKLTNAALMREMEQLIPEKWIPTYCDSTNPDKIDELWAAGFNAQPADKRPYSVRSGIDFMKTHHIYVDSESVDLIRELRHYKWIQNRQGDMSEMPLKENDHAIDACRYAAYTHWGKPPQWLVAEDVEDAILLDAA